MRVFCRQLASGVPSPENGFNRSRYYASSLGRFDTLDPAIRSVGPDNPQSWNRYSYVLGDPVNGIDLEGLCSVMIGGITQSPHTTGTSAQQEFANEIGAISAFRFAGGSIP